MELEAAKMIGAGLAAIALAGAGVGIGIIFGNYLSGAMRNPSAAQKQFPNLLLGFALAEATGLFANMMAGHTMLKVFGGFVVSLGILGGWLPLSFSVALTGLEILVAFLQAYVFAILTCIYLNDALNLHH